MPALSSALMSSMLDTPPLAMRCSCGYAAITCWYSSVAGPASVPSFEISVQSTVLTPASMYFLRKGSRSSVESSFQPLMLIFPLRTSAPSIMRSAPYFLSHPTNSSGCVTAMLPTVTIAAPASKAFSISSSVLMPPPKSTVRCVSVEIRRSTPALTICFDLAPSRSTTCSRLKPSCSNSLATSAGESR